MSKTKLIFGFLLFLSFSCENPEKENQQETHQKESLVDINLPEDRSLSPYDINPDSSVNPANLHTEIMAWQDAWTEKRVQCIAWLWGGINNNNGIKTFTDPNNPGLVVLKADLPDTEMEKIAAFAGAEYMVLEGVAYLEGATLKLMNSTVVGPFEGDSLPVGENILPIEAGTGTPFNPLDIESAIDAWKGKVLQIEGIAILPLSGNVISFKDDSGEEIVRAVMAENFDQENLDPQHVILQGEINGIDKEARLVSLGRRIRLN